MNKLLVIMLLLLITGCSVKFEVGYHGRTGRDDRTETVEFRKAKLERY